MATSRLLITKTGRIPKKVDNFQLLFYMGILSRTLNYPVSKISYLHLDEFVWHSLSIRENDTQTTRDKVLETAREIERGTSRPQQDHFVNSAIS